MQAYKVLPKLQVLDDTRLTHPLSPAPTPALLLSQGLHLRDGLCSNPPAALWSSEDTEGNLSAACSLNSTFELLSTAASLGRPHVRQNKLQRPASAGRLHQRLPPVAAGHNQPGSYLLYSLSQQPFGPLTTALAQPHQVHSPSTVSGQTATLRTSCAVAQDRSRRDCSSHRMAGVVDEDEDDDGFDGKLYDRSGAASAVLARPASAGIKRAESRLGMPMSPEGTSRYASAYLTKLIFALPSSGKASWCSALRLVLSQPFAVGVCCSAL